MPTSRSSTTSGLLQRILNDLGHDKASDFIDDFQNIINEYMKTSGYSVGINDLRANKTTCDKIIKTINDKKQEVNNLIHKSHIGIFENKTGKTNVEELETQVNKIQQKMNQKPAKQLNEIICYRFPQSRTGKPSSNFLKRNVS